MTLSSHDKFSERLDQGIEMQQLLNRIHAALRLRHPPDSWVFATEVPVLVGAVQAVASHNAFDCQRRIDAFAMALWPSLELARVAYEIKISRSDWLAEMRNPLKQGAAWYLSHRFYFVFAPGVYQPKECVKGMTGAGILIMTDDGKIQTERRAVKRYAWPMHEKFVASFLRRIRDDTDQGRTDQDTQEP